MFTTTEQFIFGFIITICMYFLITKNKEKLDNIFTHNNFTSLYTNPLSNFTEAVIGPLEYTKKSLSSPKECSDISLNSEILDYQLSPLNQTKLM